MKQEEQKIRSVFVQRETLETWLRQMAKRFFLHLF